MEEEKQDTTMDIEMDAHFMDKYSRQIGVYGIEAMGKLIKLRVFIYGMSGVGLETAKNLILAGPNAVTVCDDGLVTMSDLATNFFASKKDIGKTKRSESVASQLQELNPMVTVKVHSGKVDAEAIRDYNVLVCCDQFNKKELFELSTYCHQNGKGFITAGALGLYAYCFVDFGDKHQITDKDGETEKVSLIAHISQAEKAQVTTHEDHPHGLHDGEYCSLSEVEGMTEINEGGPYKVKKITAFSFTIDVDTTNFNAYTTGGYCNQKKVPFTVSFKTLAASLQQPYCYEDIGGKKIRMMLHNPDMMKWERAEQLHITFNALLEFVLKYGELPRLNHEGDMKELVALASEMVEATNNSEVEIEDVVKLEKIDEAIVSNVARFARAQICPTASFVGGIVAQEVVKYTGKFTPLQQWLHVEWFEALPTGDVTRELENDRYDDLIAIFGNEVCQKLRDAKVFLVGCGALGCEYIKLLAMLGVGCSEEGRVYTTDDDCIEMSNLNRQFLFREKDVKNSKSIVAAASGEKMNPDLHVEAYKIRVSPDTEKVFNDKFWEGLDGVLNALDNLKARQYVDRKCVFYTKPLFESGTLGTKCNSQVIVPYKTESYNDAKDPEEDSIPLCTLKNFPYLLDHCIQWARDYFEKQFVSAPFECSQFLKKGKDYLKELQTNNQNQFELANKLLNIEKTMKTLLVASPESCVSMARDQFEIVHHNQIANLLHNFPLDHINDEGVKFWTSPKRPPVAIKYDSNNEQIMNFIYSAANIFGFIYGLDEISKEQCKEICDALDVPEFVPYKRVIQQNEDDDVVEAGEDDEKAVKDALTFLSTIEIKETMKINVVDFEKDDDSNHHIDFIAAVANLRARNYKIGEGSRHEIKMIAGKIIPAIATSTALIVGQSGIELIKSIVGVDVEHRRNSFVNLALPLFLFSEPMPPLMKKDVEYDIIEMCPIKALPQPFSSWDKKHIYGPKTLGQIMAMYQEEFNVEVNWISADPIVLINYIEPKLKEQNEKYQQLDPIQAYETIMEEEYPPYKGSYELNLTAMLGETQCVFPNIIYHKGEKQGKQKLLIEEEAKKDPKKQPNR